LWIIGLILFVLYPMPDNQIPNAVPIVTSIPFVLVVVATLTHFARTILRRAPQQIVAPERRERVSQLDSSGDA